MPAMTKAAQAAAARRRPLRNTRRLRSAIAYFQAASLDALVGTSDPFRPLRALAVAKAPRAAAVALRIAAAPRRPRVRRACVWQTGLRLGRERRGASSMPALR